MKETINIIGAVACLIGLLTLIGTIVVLYIGDKVVTYKKQPPEAMDYWFGLCFDMFRIGLTISIVGVILCGI